MGGRVILPFVWFMPYVLDLPMRDLGITFQRDISK